MTERDDRLAPVTPLFGARASGAGRSSAPVDGEAAPSASTGDGADGWAASAAPGEDEVSLGADGDAAGAAEAADRIGADADARRSGQAAGVAATGPSGSRKKTSQLRAVDSDSGAIVSALPTYAAFAATTEGADSRVRFTDDEPSAAERRGRRSPGAGVTQADDEGSADPEPESLEAARHRAENISLHALSRRGVSSHEMAKTLRSRDLPEEVVAAEIERLERVGLLDDASLAENLVRTKQDRKGLGKGAITAELRQRGLAQEAIEQAVSEIDDDEEQARCDEWALKRAGQLRGLDQATAERRLNAFLMRRGYRSEVIRRAVEKALPRGSRGGVRFE